MALDFSKMNTQTAQQPAVATAVGTPESPTVIEPVETYDIVADRQQMN